MNPKPVSYTGLQVYQILPRPRPAQLARQQALVQKNRAAGKAYLCRMPEPAYPMCIILNVFMSDHDTGILPLQKHANVWFM